MKRDHLACVAIVCMFSPENIILNDECVLESGKYNTAHRGCVRKIFAPRGMKRREAGEICKTSSSVICGLLSAKYDVTTSLKVKCVGP
jgi:hypothetical protein